GASACSMAPRFALVARSSRYTDSSAAWLHAAPRRSSVEAIQRNPPSTKSATAMVAVAMKPDRRPRHKLLSASSSAYRKARIESSGLDHAAVIEGDGASTHTTNELAIVRGHDNGRASRVDFTEQVHDVEREIGVEVARRLIGQHDVRVVDESAGNGDALLFAPGQFLGKRVHAMLEADPLQQLERLSLPVAERDAEYAPDEPDVF